MAETLSPEHGTNRQVLLRSRPTGIPQAEHFEIVETPVPQPGPGQVLVRNTYLSADPAMRGWVSAAANYAEPVAVGAVMRSFAAGRVVASRHPAWQAGDAVSGMFGWQEWAAVDGGAGGPIGRKNNDILERGLPLSTALGVFGLNGVTAYFGLLDVGQPRAGNTVVVSSAAGSVGSCVGQIAKLSGCRTVGIAGGPAKVEQCLSEFGFDAAIDYKAGTLEADLRAACPDGVDVYFDNTAGPISDAVIGRLNVRARIVVCGTASVTEWNPPPSGPRVERHLLVRRARIEGFIATDYQHRWPEAIQQLMAWVAAGQLRFREDVLDGIEQAPGSVAALYRGSNQGKLLIRVGPG